MMAIIRFFDCSENLVLTMIYLDYAATTPVDPRVMTVMNSCLSQEGAFGNPSSVHTFGLAAAEVVEKARLQVATGIGAEADEIIWTSGATEANNLALFGIAEGYAYKGKHIITSQTEHKSVLGPCQQLEKLGFEVTYLPVDRFGRVAVADVEASMRPDTILVSIMWVNNETGCIQPVADIAKLTKASGVVFHVDAVQAVGKVAIDVHALGIDLLSISGHKMYGPKGVGALYVRRRPKLRLQPLIYGGQQERGLRAGTVATHQVAGLGEAVALSTENRLAWVTHLMTLKAHFVNKLAACLEGRFVLHGDMQADAPHIANIAFLGIEGESLRTLCYPLAVSAGSACNVTAIEPSHVLTAMGVPALEADASLRFSFGKETTFAELDEACAALVRAVKSINI